MASFDCIHKHCLSPLNQNVDQLSVRWRKYMNDDLTLSASIGFAPSSSSLLKIVMLPLRAAYMSTVALYNLTAKQWSTQFQSDRIKWSELQAHKNTHDALPCYQLPSGLPPAPTACWRSLYSFFQLHTWVLSVRPLWPTSHDQLKVSWGKWMHYKHT